MTLEEEEIKDVNDVGKGVNGEPLGGVRGVLVLKNFPEWYDPGIVEKCNGNDPNPQDISRAFRKKKVNQRCKQSSPIWKESFSEFFLWLMAKNI